MSSIVLGKTETGHPLKLDLDLLLRTRLLIQGGSGSGKSWLLRRLAEQLFGKVPVIIIDPEGEFATLREKYGYVLVGKGGETPADPRSAQLLAEKLLELHASAVCDLYEMKPAERHLWVQAFLEALIDAPKKLWQSAVIIVDEAHLFAPEKGAGESAASDAMIALTSRGRKRGYGAIFATQRLGKLRKDAAAELLNVLIGNTFIDIDRDRAADSLGVSGKSDKQTFFDQLKVLKEGQFWALGRAITIDRTLVQIGPVETSHPKAGVAKHAGEPPPAPDKVRALLPKLADLPAEAEAKQKTIADLKRDASTAQQRARQAERTVADLQLQLERAASQPKASKADVARSAQVQDLKQQLAQHQRALKEAMKILVTIKAVDFSARGGEVLEQAVLEAIKPIVGSFEKRVGALTSKVEGVKTQAAAAEQAIAKLLHEPIDLQVTVQKAAPFTITPASAPRVLPTREITPPTEGLSAPQQRILDTLAWLEQLHLLPAHKTQVALLAEASPTSSSYTNNLGVLRTAGYIEYPGQSLVTLTAGGLAIARVNAEVPTTSTELQARLFERLPGPQAAILRELVTDFPAAIEKDQLAARAGASPTSSSYTNNLGALRSLGLIDYPTRGQVVAKPVLFLEGR